MISSWPTALTFAWRPENDGQGYHVDPHDPGAGTNHGVTEATWAAALAHGHVTGGLRFATTDQLATVLRLMFWNTCQCDAILAGVDMVVFDMAMVSGPGRAARLLQRALDFADDDIDGMIGPHTLRAVRNADSRQLIRRMTTCDEEFFASLHTFTYFGRGWDRRAEDCQLVALSLVT